MRILLFIGFLFWAIFGQGAQEVINVGATANDRTGDQLRPAFIKVNNNFSNLFASSSPYADSINGILSLNLSAATNIIASGYYSANDGGGGQFYYDASSTAATNLGTVFSPTNGEGRVFRVITSPINVLWFGARRDRVNGEEPFSGFTGTDSSTNFQNALDFMSSSTNLYGELHIPAGKYTWTNAVYLNGSIILSGEGKVNATYGEGGGSQILVKGLGITALVIGTRKASMDWTIRDLSLDGFTNNAAFGIQVGDGSNEPSRGTIVRVSTRKFSGSGIRVISGNTIRIEGCDLSTTAAGSAALLFDYVTGGSINAIITSQNHIAGGSANQTDGWRILNGTQILSLGDVIEGAELGAGLLLRDTSANPGRITRNTFINTWFEQNGTNIVAYYPGLSRTMIDNRFINTFFGRIIAPSTNQVVVGNGIFTFRDSGFGSGENQVFRGMTSGIVQWDQPATNGAWYLDSAAGNPSIVNYNTQDGLKTGIGTQNPLWRLHVSNVTDTARIGLDSSNIIGSMVRTGPAISGVNVSDGISLSAGAGLGVSLLPNNGGSWGLTVTSTNISYGTAAPNPNAVFDLASPNNNKAFMPPRLTQAQRDAISSPTAGMMVYQTDSNPGIYFYDGTSWRPIPNLATLGVGLVSGQTPVTILEVADSSTASPRGFLSGQYSTGTDGARESLRKARGTRASPTTIVTGDELGGIHVWGYDGANYLDMAGIDFVSSGTIAATRVPTEARFYTATDAAPSVKTLRLTINNAGLATFTGSLNSGGSITANSQYALSSKFNIFAPTDGVVTFYNNANTDFARLQLGGTSASFPAIKRNGAAIDFKVADDSGFASINTGPIIINGTGTLTATGNILVTGATSTIRLKGYTVATLPAGTVGDTAYVTDALGPAYGVAVVGGGAVVVPVFRNATVWICQ